jgi:hypothetical protein
MARPAKHGESRKTPEYNIWCAMRQRCLNPNNDSYEDYGGRGISICEEWDEYANFLKDMGRRPSPNLTLERIDNDGNYEPGNCKWATYEEQNHNKRKQKVRKDSVLNDAKVYVIKELYKTGNISQRELANMFNYDQGNLSLIISNKIWKEEPLCDEELIFATTDCKRYGALYSKPALVKRDLFA